MRKILITILLLGLLSAHADTIPIDYRLSLRGGAIMPDGKVDVMLGQKNQWTPTVGAELALAFHPEWQALRDWNNAAIGVALSYWKLDATRNGDNDLLGHAIAPYVFLEVPFYKSKHFEIGVRPGIGCSFITKTYFNTATPEQQYQVLQAPNINRSVGSVFNFYFPEALYCAFPIRNGWSVNIAAGWYHMSNGSLRQPNSGYNIFSGEVAVRYQSPTTKDDVRCTMYDVRRTKEHKRWSVELAFTGGGRQVYYRDKQTFFCSTMQLSAYWLAHPIFRLGGGVDVFYDGAYAERDNYYKKTYLGGATQADCWRVGVSVQPEFVIGQFTAGIHFGVYLYDPIKNREVESGSEAHSSLWEKGELLDKGVFYAYDLLNAGSAGYPDGWLYTQIVLRYHLPYHLFVQASMKAHLTKVEFVSAGLGVYI